MRSIVAIVFGLMMLAIPNAGHAHTIVFPILQFPLHGDTTFSFGLDGYHLRAGFDRLEFDGADVFPTVFGQIEIVSGPLLMQTSVVAPDGTVRTGYFYEPGLVTIDAFWDSPFGSAPDGHFEATVNRFSSIAVAELPFALGRLALGLGPGRFDAALAALLGISGGSCCGGLLLDINAIDGDATSAIRSALFSTGTANLRVTVPEPSLAALAIICTGAWSLRRRRHRRYREA